MEPQISQAGASSGKWANWSLNCCKSFASACNDADVSAIAEPTRAPIRLAGSVDPVRSISPCEGTSNGVDMFVGVKEGCLAPIEVERAGFSGTTASALTFVPAFASAIFLARSLVFSTTSLAVVVFLLSAEPGTAVLLGVFLSA